MMKSFHTRIESSQNAIESVLINENVINEAAQAICTTLRTGGRIYACGNGGSAAEAMHFATELCGRYRSNRVPYPAIALTADGTALTCIGNDFGWDLIFARQVEANASQNDLLLVLTTSGNSTNVIAALQAARSKGIKTVGLLGRNGDDARALCDLPIIIAVDDTGSIQEAHLVVIHILCEPLEESPDSQ
ncbi:D-sedoheptulose 7-phosphate isomerase [Prosthecobacter fusiformis]|uniref:D-sedoheptulose 7-phosphate isomerase n=1 Tax=Prosthecobacter fusiformis TaxID=48464 RepID=A0A4R7S2D3_9BACT|nr:SIS domain-containing protein [Prosthecobacter fusiformis]TDU71415.1 D-sedoheptulose 7-phosphate isomerase [Prosthecobacter fusiformis]